MEKGTGGNSFDEILIWWGIDSYRRKTWVFYWKSATKLSCRRKGNKHPCMKEKGPTLLSVFPFHGDGNGAVGGGRRMRYAGGERLLWMRLLVCIWRCASTWICLNLFKGRLCVEKEICMRGKVCVSECVQYLSVGKAYLLLDKIKLPDYESLSLQSYLSLPLFISENQEQSFWLTDCIQRVCKHQVH